MENLPDLLHAAAGLDLRFRLRVELAAGENAKAVEEIRRLLRALSEDLDLQ